ncbi:beta-N-acetylhexosaminidase [Lederbergia lenta]|uniref:Glycoside hydrolase family protein n=1 Tax=Lederbergia lenta TaxID=1467 RepID=A0A2X4VXL5_LEDLE|nr:beta-N-acetylhexosaminidase [Lederbergia lenta]MEC2326377.1 beta-N-acetylhexosaminidase [Lederbergia lenta]SQI51372.1 glycoside hydrolase family protein [Lederbergia lenta]
MNITFTGEFSPLIKSVEEYQKELGFTISKDGIPITVEQQDEIGLDVSLEAGEGKIIYSEKVHFFRAFGLLLEHLQKKKASFHLKEEPQFSSVGPMFDLSRNAVMNIDSFKGIIRKLALMGFNSTMLYMEDTFEMKSEPYFGYMRGRYSQEELKDLDDYADQYGIELIPCIQTLAHLEEFLKWSAVSHYKDTRGALLLESEKTYTFIENMIASASAPFRSNRIHIGMDEAEEVGRGIYLNKNGYKPRFELMSEHLGRVLDITEKQGLEVMMWSDMFLKLASTTGDQYSAETEIPDYIIENTPKNVQLMYWRYNETNKDHYTEILRKHKAFGRTPAFAGGIWVWNTFATNYGLSLNASDAALAACKEEGVQDVFVTLWGDDGYENNFYSALLGLQMYAEHAYSKELNKDKLRDRVKFCTGIDEETYLLLNELDDTPGVESGNKDQTNPSKFLLWQDILLGLFDKHIEGLDLKTHYERLEDKIKEKRNPDHALDYIFEVPEKLSAVLALKAGVGVKLKQAYDNQDIEELKNITGVELPEIAKRVEALRHAHRNQWFKMNKPFGWEVIDIRYGGLLSRIDTAIHRVSDFIEQRVKSIEELEQKRLYFTQDTAESTGLGWCSYYYRIASPNVFFHVLPIY